LPCREAQETVCCGHVYCKSCLDQLKFTDSGHVCPYCRKEKFVVFPSRLTDRQVISLKIKCPNKAEGCKWVGELYDVDKHLKGCFLKCKYFDIGCETKMYKEEQTEHYSAKMADHLQLLSKKHHDSVQLNSLHKRLSFILCLIIVMFMGMAMYMIIRILDNENLIREMEHTARYYQSTEKLQWPLLLTELSEVPPHEDKTTPTILRMVILTEKKMRNEKYDQWYSDAFFAFNKGYKMCLSVTIDVDTEDSDGENEDNSDGESAHISVYLYLMKGPYDDELEQSGHFPLRGTFTVELLNQLNDGYHYIHNVILDHYTCEDCSARVKEKDLATSGYALHDFISYAYLAQSNYMINHAIYFRVSYEKEDQSVWPVLYDTFLHIIWLVIKLNVILISLLIVAFEVYNRFWESPYWFFILLLSLLGYGVGIGCGINDSIDDSNVMLLYTAYYLIKPLMPGVLAALSVDIIEWLKSVTNYSNPHSLIFCTLFAIGSFVVGSGLGGLLWAGLTIMIAGLCFSVFKWISDKVLGDGYYRDTVGVFAGYIIGGMLGKLFLVNVLFMPWSLMVGTMFDKVLGRLLFVDLLSMPWGLIWHLF